MGNQTINIEKIDGGVVNIYNSSEEDACNKLKKINIAAVDKYSSPISASISISPFGDKGMHKVSCLIYNDLISQVIENNNIVVYDEKNAKRVMKEAISIIERFKKEAEENFAHSAIIVPKIRNAMDELEKRENKIHKPESDDLLVRNDMSYLEGQNFQGPIPLGLVLHPVEDHFPDHGGIVKDASMDKDMKRFGEKNIKDEHSWYREAKIKHMPSGKWRVTDESGKKNLGESDSEEGAKKRLREVEYFKNKKSSYEPAFEVFEKLAINKSKISVGDLSKIAYFLCPSEDDEVETSNIKTLALSKIRNLLACRNQEEMARWIDQHNGIFKEALNMLGEVSMIKIAATTKNISADDYDLFIFDADMTIWDSEEPAFTMIPPFNRIDEDTIVDSNSKYIRLKENVRETLRKLREMGRDIGLISKSEKEGVDYQDQPVILLLREFGILDYFNRMIVVARNFPKSIFVPRGERAVVIDDDIKNLMDISEHSDADAVDANDVAFLADDDMQSAEVEEDLIPDKDFKIANVILQEDPDEEIITAGNEISRENKPYSWFASIDSEENIGDIVYNGFTKGSHLHGFLRQGDKNALEIILTDSGLDKVCLSGRQFISRSEAKRVAMQTLETAEQERKEFSIREAREYIPKDEQPPKPKGKGKYELDHKTPRWKYKGNPDKKENLHWVPKDKHKNKTKNEGSFDHGGELHQKQEKSKGKKHYKDYQSNAGQAKVSKERKEMGEKAFSEKQRQRAKARWSYSIPNRLVTAYSSKLKTIIAQTNYKFPESTYYGDSAVVGSALTKENETAMEQCGLYDQFLEDVIKYFRESVDNQSEEMHVEDPAAMQKEAVKFAYSELRDRVEKFLNLILLLTGKGQCPGPNILFQFFPHR